MLRVEKPFLDQDEEHQSAELDGYFDQNLLCKHVASFHQENTNHSIQGILRNDYKNMTILLKSFENLDFGSGFHPIEKIDEIVIAHPDAAV